VSVQLLDNYASIPSYGRIPVAVVICRCSSWLLFSLVPLPSTGFSYGAREYEARIDAGEEAAQPVLRGNWRDVGMVSLLTVICRAYSTSGDVRDRHSHNTESFWGEERRTPSLCKSSSTVSAGCWRMNQRKGGLNLEWAHVLISSRARHIRGFNPRRISTPNCSTTVLK
jgi:hypothetical protein